MDEKQINREMFDDKRHIKNGRRDRGIENLIRKGEWDKKKRQKEGYRGGRRKE